MRKLTRYDNLILDIGCGNNSPCQVIKNKRIVGLDGFLPYIIESKGKGIHDDYVLCDIRYMPIKNKTVDTIVALEVIEHFDFFSGSNLLKCFENIAKNRIIVSTPNGWLHQNEFDGNHYQKHLSAWYPRNFVNRNYKVFGVNGLKMFRHKIQASNANTPKTQGTTLKSTILDWMSYLLSKMYYHTPRLTSGLLALKIITDDATNPPHRRNHNG